jgi:serine/threonine protein kinase
MAPEQLHGLAVDQRADIWAIGALLFELASGGATFRARPAAVALGGARR